MLCVRSSLNRVFYLLYLSSCGVGFYFGLLVMFRLPVSQPGPVGPEFQPLASDPQVTQTSVRSLSHGSRAWFPFRASGLTLGARRNLGDGPEDGPRT